LKATELYRWTARETRWKRYMVSRESPVTLVSLRPSSCRNAMPVVFIRPRVSKARGWKMWEDGKDEYFADFLLLLLCCVCFVDRFWFVEVMSRGLDSDLWYGWWHQTLQCTASKVWLHL